MNAPRQLALALPHAESFAREDFLTGAPNEAALAMIERWPDWPDRALALVGPEGAGKSHLAAIWAEIAGARRVSARALGETDLLGALATGALVIEDASGAARRARAVPPAQPDARGGGLPADHGADCAGALERRAARSRVAPACAFRPSTLSAPDDALLRAVLVKLFADRQLGVDESLIGYLVTRIERSFAAARAAVETLDREALRMKRPVTRALAAELLRET